MLPRQVSHVMKSMVAGPLIVSAETHSVCRCEPVWLLNGHSVRSPATSTDSRLGSSGLTLETCRHCNLIGAKFGHEGESHPKEPPTLAGPMPYDLPMLTFDLLFFVFLKMHGSAEMRAWGRSKVNIIQNYVDLWSTHILLKKCVDIWSTYVDLWYT